MKTKKKFEKNIFIERIEDKNNKNNKKDNSLDKVKNNKLDTDKEQNNNNISSNNLKIKNKINQIYMLTRFYFNRRT